jgi:hypothetical protein
MQGLLNLPNELVESIILICQGYYLDDATLALYTPFMKLSLINRRIHDIAQRIVWAHIIIRGFRSVKAFARALHFQPSLADLVRTIDIRPSTWPELLYGRASSKDWYTEDTILPLLPRCTDMSVSSHLGYLRPEQYEPPQALWVPMEIIYGWARSCLSLNRLRITYMDVIYFRNSLRPSLDDPALLSKFPLHLNTLNLHLEAPAYLRDTLLKLIPYNHNITHLALNTEGTILFEEDIEAFGSFFGRTVTHLDVGNAPTDSLPLAVAFPNLVYLRHEQFLHTNPEFRFKKLVTLVVRLYASDHTNPVAQALQSGFMPNLQHLMFHEIAYAEPRRASARDLLERSNLPALCQQRGIELSVINAFFQREDQVLSLLHPHSSIELDLTEIDHIRLC